MLQVPKLGVMLVGWGGNNGSTVTAAQIANKLNMSWHTKEGVKVSSKICKYYLCKKRLDQFIKKNSWLSWDIFLTHQLRNVNQVHFRDIIRRVTDINICDVKRDQLQVNDEPTTMSKKNKIRLY